MEEAKSAVRAIGAHWAAADGPTTKQRQGAQRAVTRLLDVLAPEVPATRFETTRGEGEVHRMRTARGCILQGNASAVTVSWFPSAGSERSLGELQVILWRGTVSRPGSASRSPGGAVTLREDTFLPIEEGEGAWRWRAKDGSLLDTDSLAGRCRTLLGDPGTTGVHARTA